MRKYAVKMSTHRVFYENSRLSTAVVTKNHGFLQVYPVHQVFESETHWKKHWENEILKKIRFEIEESKPKKDVKDKSVHEMSRNELVDLLLSMRAAPSKTAEVGPPTPASAKKAEVGPPTPASAKKAEVGPPAPESLMWSFKEETCKVTLPAGKYYIGDLCYAVRDDIYDKVYGGQGYGDGLYSSSLGSFMMYGTGGDGVFNGSDGYEYPVDAGHIGIASLACCNSEDKIYGGKVFTFTEPVECSFDDIAFNFYSGNFSLRISNHEDYNEDYEEEGDCLTEDE
jgi:hypothetical protein